MTAGERKALREFLEVNPRIEKVERYKYRIVGHDVDFTPVIPIQTSDKNIPVWLAKNAGLLKMIRHQALPAIWESLKA